MSFSNGNQIIEAVQIDGSDQKCIEQQNSENKFNELQTPQLNKDHPTILEYKSSLKLDFNDQQIIFLQIEAGQLERAIHACHWLGIVFLCIITTIKLFGLNQHAKESIALAILIIFSLLIWIVSVIVGTIGVKRQLMKSLLLYQIGLIVSLMFDLVGTIVIITTDHQINHQLEKYGNNPLVRQESIVTKDLQFLWFWKF